MANHPSDKMKQNFEEPVTVGLLERNENQVSNSLIINFIIIKVGDISYARSLCFRPSKSPSGSPLFMN